ncbi:hypothetical protein EJB05_38281, partial [Eragrostis curvula]
MSGRCTARWSSTQRKEGGGRASVLRERKPEARRRRREEEIEELSGASLKDKKNLEKLQLSWKDNLPQDEYDCSLVSDSNNSSSSTHFADRASDVLEGLEPHNNLKYLQISGYSGATSPAWLVNSVTRLRDLHLDDCREWQILSSLENLLFLIKLKLTNMKKIIKVSIPSLEELVLFNLPKLELCSCNSVMDLNSSLRVLKISNCNVLKSFPLFESCEKFNIEQKSWFCRLDKLTIHYCSQLKIPNHLPPSNIVSELSIRGVLEVPDMKGSPDENLDICPLSEDPEATMLDDKRFAYHNLRMLTSLSIRHQNREYVSFQGFRQLINLKYFTMEWCKEIFSSHVVQEPTGKNMAAANESALPSLGLLAVSHCGIAAKWLSVLLRHVKAVEEFKLYKCQMITALSIEEEESNLSELRSGPEASSSGSSYNNALAIPPSDGLLCMPSNLLSSVKKISIVKCGELIYQGSKVGFARFTSLEELQILECPKLIPSLVHSGENFDSANGKWFLPLSLCSIRIDPSPEKLQLCFPENRSSLRKLHIWGSPRLKSLQLHSCTALEELTIERCESLAALEGLQSLGGLTALKVFSCPGLPDLKHLSRQGLGQLRLECLGIDKFSFLNMPVWMRLTPLKRLEVFEMEVTGLSDLSDRIALQLLTSLQELLFSHCHELQDLAVGLNSLPSLRKLEIYDCPHITWLPEQILPPSLEELEMWECDEQLTERCRMLATSKLKVKIDGFYLKSTHFDQHDMFYRGVQAAVHSTGAVTVFRISTNTVQSEAV